MCWRESANIPNPGPDKSISYPHTLLATLCQYIRDNSFILAHCWLHCVHISETTVLSSNNVGHTVYIYQRQKFYPHKLLATLCTCIGDKRFIEIYVFCAVHFNVNHIILTRYWLHCVRISETTVLSSHDVG